MARTRGNPEQHVLDLVEEMDITKAETVTNMLIARLRRRQADALAMPPAAGHRAVHHRKPKSAVVRAPRTPRARKTTPSVEAPAAPAGSRARFGATASAKP